MDCVSRIEKRLAEMRSGAQEFENSVRTKFGDNAN